MNRRTWRIAGWAWSLLVLGGATQAATAWTADPAQSRLEFVATQAGGTFDGRFARFQAETEFDPAELPAGRLRVEVDIASAETGNDERDGVLVGPDFFAVERWPTATFTADRFAARGPGRFEAAGTLTLRGVAKDLTLDFTFVPAGGGVTAEMAGTTTLRRLDFGVGQGEWRDTDWVGDEVRIRFKLILHRR